MTTTKEVSAIIIGGAGAMGRWAVRAIARLGSVSELLIADIDLDKAQRLVDEVGEPCRAIRLDATDADAMREAFAECDVVLNTMGPFSLFARRILEVAIESGCDYLDIDDDWESTLEAFELDAAAREKGLHVIKGIGGSPGFSNMCALVAARQLDKVDELFTGWSLRGAVTEEEAAFPAPAGASAAVEHWLIQVSGSIRTWRDGREQDVAPLESVSLDYPGIGRVHAYTVGHPEAITLPRYVAGVSRSTNLTSGPEWIFEHVRKVAAAYTAGEVSLAEGARRLDEPPVPADLGPRDPLSQCWAAAYGLRDGRPVAVSVEPAAVPRGKMGGGTGVPLAIGLELLRRGRITRTGVHAPEGAIEPDDFFALYGNFVELPEGKDPLVIRELDDPSPISFG
ncbi:saccharopine dehydrogenase family protein [Streptomyces sp. NPDC015346]|uniref:saccharopine dehydrogenase family protein n=1 Tax=Streptomyces sp. NPDC015346 TaxID=3364954 RepID=UPI0036F9F293